MAMNIQAVILDWAGTTVDFGCFAPVAAFQAAFATLGLTPTIDETRAPMGMQKRAHIETMLSGKRLRAEFVHKFDREWTASDVDLLYRAFEPALFAVLKGHGAVMPGVPEAVLVLRGMGVKIGSSTGYTEAMMEVVTHEAQKGGYAPDALVCPDEVGGIGRPYPYMLFRNLEKLGVMDVRRVFKLGDTVADIQEGKNAGCISCGAIRGSSVLGLSEDEHSALSEAERDERYARTRATFLDAGADFVIDSIEELPALIQRL